MAKLTLSDISSFTNDSTAVSLVNNNSNLIEAAMENTLSRDGAIPNFMNSQLDMNSYPIINLPSPILPTEPVRLQDLDDFVSTAIAATTGATGFTSTIATLSVASFDSTISHVTTGGYGTVGDGGHAIYKKVVSEPSHAGKVQSADGKWWELVFNDWINVRWFGAKLDNVNDDTTAINNAIAALGASGGTIFFPGGRAKCSGTIDLVGRRSIILQGTGGVSGGAAVSMQLAYTGAGSRFIDARTTAGVWIKDLTITYNNNAFTGSLVDFTHGPSGFDSALGGVERCLCIPEVSPGTAILINLDQAILTVIRDCNLAGGKPAIKGQSIGGTYSNDILIENCTFINHVGYAVTGPGSNWTFINCTWEASLTGLVQAVAQASTTSCHCITFINCNTVDTSAPGGTAFSFGGATNTADNITFLGGNYGGESTGSNCITFEDGGTVLGVTILGIRIEGFNGGISFGTGTKDAVFISGCYAVLTTVPLSGVPSGDNWYIENNTPVTMNARKSYTVATLPTASSFTGKTVFCSNVRVSGEGAGVGTGGMVNSNGSVWKVAGTNVTAAA